MRSASRTISLAAGGERISGTAALEQAGTQLPGAGAFERNRLVQRLGRADIRQGRPIDKRRAFAPDQKDEITLGGVDQVQLPLDDGTEGEAA